MSGYVTRSSTQGTTQARTFEAHDVRDFAWASGPLSKEEGTAPTGVLVSQVWWPSSISKDQADSSARR